MNILLVISDNDLLDLLSLCLTDMGHSVKQWDFENNSFIHDGFDLVMVDLGLGKTGEDIYQSLIETQNLSTRFLFLSVPEEQEYFPIFKNDKVHFLNKPFSCNALYETIQNA